MYRKDCSGYWNWEPKTKYDVIPWKPCFLVKDGYIHPLCQAEAAWQWLRVWAPSVFPFLLVIWKAPGKVFISSAVE